MKRILVLGAGMVAGPLVRYLLEHGYELTVTSLILAEAEALVDGHSAGRCLQLDLDDEATVSGLVADADLVVSLVPYAYHPVIARHCLAHGSHLITASYVADEMADLDAGAKTAGLCFLNEIGLDPGIDHMSAMRLIDDVRARGGRITSFRSYCGGLPAPEANDNPFGYKFSWAPRGVLLASRNGAQYRVDGCEMNTEPKRLFRDMELLAVPGAGDFESYPNRDSLSYIDIYGLEGIETMLRGTLRNMGWCDTLYCFRQLGLLSLDERPAAGLSRADFLADLLGVERGSDLARAASTKLQVSSESLPVLNLVSLGLTGDEPVGADSISPLDLLAARMLDTLVYAEGERDMVVLYHQFEAVWPDGRREHLTSSLIDFAKDGASAMARTVSLPAAIAADLILGGGITSTGVLRPVVADIYEPILARLADLGIECREEKTILEGS